MLTPFLREDIELIPGGTDSLGQGVFIIRDVVRNRYLEINVPTFRVLCFWKGGQEIDAFCRYLLDQGIRVGREEIAALVAFLHRESLTRHSSPEFTRHVLESRDKQRRQKLKRALESYLFFKIPIFYPQAFLLRTVRFANLFFSRGFMGLILALFVVNLLFLVPQWDRLTSSFYDQSSFGILVSFGLAFLFAKAIHELAHAYAAVRKDCHVASLGIAFMLGAPLLYADVSDTWRLKNSRDRLQVSAAGVLSELALAVLATSLWLLNLGPLVTEIALYLAMTTWLSSLLINLNPFMRFDGYYILSDILGEKNLHQTCFDEVKGALRQVLFGMRRTPRDLPRPRSFYVTFGVATMIYRVVIVLGIALLLYHFVFRLLGILLFIIELWWFITRPIYKEAREVWAMRSKLSRPRAAFSILALVALVLTALLVPFQSQVVAPAVATRERVYRVVSLEPGQVVQPSGARREAINNGQNVIGLSNEALRTALRLAQVRVATLEERISRVNVVPERRAEIPTLNQALRTEQSKVEGLQRQLAQLQLHAASDGVYLPLQEVAAGQWLQRGAPLGEVVAGEGRIIALVSETDVASVRPGQEAWFYDEFAMRPVRGTVTAIDYAALPTIPYPELASVYGGPLRAHGTTQSGLYAAAAVYRVEIKADAMAAQHTRLSGWVQIAGERRTLLDRAWNVLAQSLRREAYLY